MPSTKPKFTLRTEKEILDKISYIANKNGRSTNMEIIYEITKYIKEYEKEHGEIHIEE